MLNKASFQTRARAIDHLGRGQIADAPTAISELWKNAYDAYARKVELHIFGGDPVIATVFDNGHGMNIDELLSNWLVIGTESKVGSSPKPEDCFGLPSRRRQGEKGIGRLSAAYLAPMTLVITKRVGHPFTAILVDWRFFENPFLLVSDVEFPIIEFGEIKEIPERLPTMFKSLKENLCWQGTDDAKAKRLSAAWDSFDKLEQNQGLTRTTRDAILSFDISSLLAWPHVYPWWNMMNETPEDDLHGTAMFAIQANTELSCWVEDDYESEDATEVKKDLRDTLVSFTDPYSEGSLFLEYAVVVHEQDRPSHIVIHSEDAFPLSEFQALEHCLEGEFDERGVFRGRVKAFGKDRGLAEIRPPRLLSPKGRDRLGPFKFCIGTVEFDQKSTTHTDEEYSAIRTKAEKYGGICIYRDGLRVMPYGREGADLFEIERRRSLHAGREFFSYRRSFGRVSFTSKDNPNLKDKAGREGLVDNKARREMERLVKKLLMEVARAYFGTDSTLRDIELPGIKKRNAAMRKAAETARKRNLRNFRKMLKNNMPQVAAANKEAKHYLETFSEAAQREDKDLLSTIKCEVERLDALRDEMRLPARPAASENDEDDYRAFRDAYAEFCMILNRLKQELARCEAEGLLGNPRRIAVNKFHSNESRLSSQIGKALGTIEGHLNTLRLRWSDQAREDRALYNKSAVHFLTHFDQGAGLSPVLNMLDSAHAELREDLELKYASIINSLEQLVENVDLEGAFAWADQENARLEEKMQMLHGVAQLGISVEIIGHELEALESQVTGHLRRMPKAVRDLTSYKFAYEAYRALIDRLRFLTPLKKTAYRNRIQITGKEIGDYLRDFFGDTFVKHRIDFIVTPAFEGMHVRDLPSRIYPTFINLVNNALYWVQYGERRIIQLDFVNGKTIVADSGKGVDKDDLGKLFELFFTRRSNGRGIGLYLCRQNLAVAHHNIRYADESDTRLLEGANFIIEFNGVEHA
ncbi:sensor histidine kinase [Desulfocurvibacter africanus]|uniref:sensor histidine kinase n=1 Tax=Desulfocurvibacter africanus TaxID=873 RepID=UPI002FD8F25B